MKVFELTMLMSLLVHKMNLHLALLQFHHHLHHSLLNILQTHHWWLQEVLCTKFLTISRCRKVGTILKTETKRWSV